MMNQNTLPTPSPNEITQLHADICSALGDPRRIKLLYSIESNPKNVSDLADEIGISQPAASRHLKILKNCGLIEANRQGACVEYTIIDQRLILVLNLLRSILNDRLISRAKLVE